MPKATQYFADKARVECRVEKPLCRIERKFLDEKKSGDRCHEWKTCHKASRKQKNKKDMIERLLKGGDRRTEYSPQILRAKTSFNTRELGTRSNEEKPRSPFFVLLFVTVPSVT